MNNHSSYPEPTERRSRFIATESVTEFRDRRKLEETERAELRRTNMAELCSDVCSAGDRIRAWEKLYSLRLPLVSGHPVLQAIAAATQLTLAEIQSEQRLRSARQATKTG